MDVYVPWAVTVVALIWECQKQICVCEESLKTPGLGVRISAGDGPRMSALFRPRSQRRRRGTKGAFALIGERDTNIVRYRLGLVVWTLPRTQVELSLAPDSAMN